MVWSQRRERKRSVMSRSANEPDLDSITDEAELRRLAYKFHGYLVAANKSTKRRGDQRDRLYIAMQAAARHLRRWLGPDLVSPGNKQPVADTLQVLEDELEAFQRPCGRLREVQENIENLAARTPNEIQSE